MIVVGVTGTNGKSTTVKLISEILSASGKKVGFISTAEIQIGKHWVLNDMKMTMPGRNILQKLLCEMQKAGCEYAIVETSSQGVEQYRHIGVNYDVAVFTNLTPEHIEAHGGFENYKAAKGKFFSHLASSKRKVLDGKTIEKVSVINLDDPHSGYFLQFEADKKFGYSIEASYDLTGTEETRACDISLTSRGSKFIANGMPFETNLLGLHNIYNCLAAISACFALGIPLSQMAAPLKNVSVPGRMEFIQEGQDFIVLIDYAPEPQSVSKLYKTLELFPKRNIIHILGSCGGGRDRARRPVLGRLAGKLSHTVIVTNEDPYDDDPNVIIREVALGAREAGKVDGKNLFTFLDRRAAIQKAFKLAGKNDIVIITGKGCEQAIVGAHGKKIPWDDRRVAREELKKIKTQSNNL